MPAPKELDPSASLPALYGVKLRKLRVRAVAMEEFSRCAPQEPT
ncbi:hypothetical protein [Streptomyces lancefieldiae]|uniref:Uncharacterized protein n=1 Tax=Streptomyces lancefieldiae TaxID=3075520 RepID=A0ABU3AX87_9ACTN|nr:hypothetical protein [Streptomyces sp. DSM 40712]MDT0614794.1 hypothetical protein [Streptomyces sp. DSM 40712]